MSIIPDEELKRYGNLNLAPMVDFLFLVVAVFATFAVTRAALFEGDLKLVKLRPAQDSSTMVGQNDYFLINLSVDGEGSYRWITEFNEYIVENVEGIQQEIRRQQSLGLLPQEKEQTRVLLHIDRDAKWEPIAKLIFAVREEGLDIHPVYDIDDDASVR